MKIGANVQSRGVHFHVWAPAASRVELEIAGRAGRNPLEPGEDGYFSVLVDDAGPATRYSYFLDERGPFPDPASRFQPDGPHGPSQVVDPNSYAWRDETWPGLARAGQVIYELHIGTFTRPGTWRAAQAELARLAELGITMLELMPVAEFPGQFGWGYDGVCLYAPYHVYGEPDDMRAFVDAAHALGMGVILDVVYNHLGPDGNYLQEFSPDYFSKRYGNEWGLAINFDDDNSAQVREFFAANATYWIDEYHLDGLRLDATQQIFDASDTNIMAEVTARARSAAGNRGVYVVGESETQDVRLLNDFNLDALWNDDFHHCAKVALTGKREAYYTDYHGAPQEFIAAIKRGFLYQGQYYTWQKQKRGTATDGLTHDRFVHFLENHDQVANAMRGRRLHDEANHAQLRALTALLLLGPETPMLFQGQECWATQPFLYFADHKPEIAVAVREGRAGFLKQFPSFDGVLDPSEIPDAVSTFERCKLNIGASDNEQALALHRDLLGLRRKDAVFSRAHKKEIDGAVLAEHAFCLRYFDEGNDRLMLFNLGADLMLSAIAEPLVAAPDGADWQIVWSSEDSRYGGSGVAPVVTGAEWKLPAHSAAVLAP